MEFDDCTVFSKWAPLNVLETLASNAIGGHDPRCSYTHEHSFSLCSQRISVARKRYTCLFIQKRIWNRCDCREFPFRHVYQVWGYTQCKMGVWKNVPIWFGVMEFNDCSLCSYTCLVMRLSTSCPNATKKHEAWLFHYCECPSCVCTLCSSTKGKGDP